MLTSQQSAVLGIIERYFAVHGTGPTYREIATRFGCCKSNAFRIVTDLQERGFVSCAHGRRNSIFPLPHRGTALRRLIDTARAVAAGRASPESLAGPLAELGATSAEDR